MLTAFTTLALLALLGWLYLLGGHGWFWLTDQRLPRVSSLVRRWPPVTAVVPARDEAAMLPETLPSLLRDGRARSGPWPGAPRWRRPGRPAATPWGPARTPPPCDRTPGPPSTRPRPGLATCCSPTPTSRTRRGR